MQLGCGVTRKAVSEAQSTNIDWKGSFQQIWLGGRICVGTALKSKTILEN